MFPVRTLVVLFVGHCVSGQFFQQPFGSFPPGPPPPMFFTVTFVFPPVTLQAKAGGGLRASIPDDCGVEAFEFESKKKGSDEWTGGNVTAKTGGDWIYENPLVLLAPGDILTYRCRVKQRGSYLTNPDTEWIVPDLAERFDPPRPPKKAEECPEDSTSTTKKPDDKKEETTPKPDDADNDEPTENPDDEETTDKPEKRMKKPNKKKGPTKMKNEELEEEEEDEEKEKKKEDPKTPDCPPSGPKPGETREEALERKLWKVQCDMIQLAERSFKLNEALSNELTELKKLNYVVVTRIQRLESLVRNLNRPLPLPVFPFN